MYRLALDLKASRIVLIAGILLAASLLAMVLQRSAFAQDSVIEYPENGEHSVATLTATDPEGDEVTWSVTGGADSGLFAVGPRDGILKFNNPPDYEATATGGGDSNNDNTYEVIVTATDSATPTPNTKTFTLNVKVTNVEEAGEVIWTVDPDGAANSALDTSVNGGEPIVQFQGGATLAVLATGGVLDGDVPATPKDVTERLQWSRSSSKTGTWTPIAKATGDSYNVTTDDIGMYIRVEAFYNVGTGREESASLSSDYPVLASRSNNQAPKFSPATVSMSISEGKKGITVGAPVTATDDVSNALNYVLGGDDRGRFKIDRKTGQITTSADLDFDETTLGIDGGSEDQCVVRNSCEVTVTATDSAGLASSAVATVTIKITDVNEKPTFSAADSAASPPTNLKSADNAENTNADIAVYTATDPEDRSLTYHLMGPDANKFQFKASRALSFTGKPDYESPADANRDNVYEVTVRASDGSLYDDRMVAVTVTNAGDAPTVSGPSSVEYDENGTGPVATFTATDPDGDAVTWAALSGVDSGDFAISTKGVLTFSTKPDFENAVDDGTNNTYNVTVNATDGTNTEDFDVTVKVTNQNEPGEVTWTVDPAGSPGVNILDTDATPLLQFQVGAVLVASVTDGDISGATKTVDPTDNSLTWRWYKGGTPISGENTATYDVESTDVGSRIRVTAFYTVGTGREESASLTSDYPVLDTRTSNDAPEFSPATVTREVAEGDKGAKVGAPVTATDDISNALNYVLGGDDRGRFKIDRKTGQITTNADLDFDETTLGIDGGSEDQCVVRNSCEVTVTATDSVGEQSSPVATVTIKITDVDEKPTFGPVDSGASPPTNLVSADYVENASGTAADIALYTVTDPEGLNVNLTLMGTDAARFALSSGTGGSVLSFVKAPDYEMPSDANRDNRYELTVRASDGKLHTDRMVTVTVTNFNEAPKITVAPATGLRVSGRSSQSVAEGTTAVATYTASGPDAASARWTRSGTDAGDFRISNTGVLTFATTPDYEDPADASGDNVYTVTVTATDSEGASDSIDVTVTVTDVPEQLPPQPTNVVDEYDTDNSGRIDKSELADGVFDYEIERTLSKSDLADLIFSYEIGG